ncbi:MAG: lycopene cyclase domain-containing protein [Bacteroidetes bacterium]|nr:lycopene cyclase domain-containing protein [Bacteroidota bacterium]
MILTLFKSESFSRFTYLALDVFTLLFPLIFSFDTKVHFFKRWRYLFPAIFFTAFFFIIWDYFKTKYGVWSFNDQYILGYRLAGMPVEEYLFFFVVPYACIFIYDVLRFYLKPRSSPKSITYIVQIIGLAMLFSSFFFINRAYTFAVLFILGLLLPISAAILTAEKLVRFIQMYLLSFLPMFVVNGYLTALPVVIYNNAHNIGYRLGTIPIEDFLYSAILLLMNVAVYEWFQIQNNTNPNIRLTWKSKFRNLVKWR